MSKSRRGSQSVKARRSPSRTGQQPTRSTERGPAARGSRAEPRDGLPPSLAIDDGERASVARVDLGPAGREEPKVEHIPWSYGCDRITAAAVDPDKLFVYWEVTDPAIERARGGLGNGGPGAWLCLRVYDTTGLLFDGTNARAYFDHSVDRSTRQWFFHIAKPTSTAFVEIGMKSPEGYFVRIARSNRVDFPRKGLAAMGEAEWMTVLPGSGEVKHAGHGNPSHGGDGGNRAYGFSTPHSFTPIPLWEIHETAEGAELRFRELLEQGWERSEWRSGVQGERWFQFEGRVEWLSPTQQTTWEAGPFEYPVEIGSPSREEWQGRSFAYRVGGVTRVVYGPWQVVIRNVGAHQERAVIGRWEVYRSWVTEKGREVQSSVTRTWNGRGGSSELLSLGGSEKVWLGASELRFVGASGLWKLGASELRYGGASETLFAAASQWMFRGASEVRMRGASETLLRGASERRLLGASETLLRGASERRFLGASERIGASERMLGASERMLGASERMLGGSEGRLGEPAQSPWPSYESSGAYPHAE